MDNLFDLACVIVFLIYTIGVFVSGFSVGYHTAINDMKKVRNRK